MEKNSWYVETISQLLHRAVVMRFSEEFRSTVLEVKEIDTGERKNLFSMTEEEIRNLIGNNDFNGGFNLYLKKGKMESPMRINPKDAETFYAPMSDVLKNKSKNLTLKMQKDKNDEIFAFGKLRELKIILATAAKNKFVSGYKLEEKYNEPISNASYVKGKDRNVWKLFSKDHVLKLEIKGNKTYIMVFNKD